LIVGNILNLAIQSGPNYEVILYENPTNYCVISKMILQIEYT